MQKVPNPTRLVHINVDEVARLAPAELPTTLGVLAHERLLDHKVQFWHDAQR